MHKVLATASGAAGGAFGLVTLPIELPVSTIIMLRSIAEIARSEGEDPSDPEAALSCIQVFVLGGRAGSPDASESGYFAVRGMLAKSVSEAARFVAERGLIEEGAPIVVRFISQVASRFGVVLTQKFAAQALPLVGALGGASVNYLFIEHFQETAQGHSPCAGWKERMERTLYGRNMSVLHRSTEVHSPRGAKGEPDGTDERQYDLAIRRAWSQPGWSSSTRTARAQVSGCGSGSRIKARAGSNCKRRLS